MKNALLIGVVIAFCATPSAPQLFENTNLDPFAIPYPAPPFYSYNNRVVSVTFETSSNVVEALVPTPLDPMGGTQITVRVIDYGIYKEALVEVPVRYQGVNGVLDVILYLDHTLAIISGRERWGFSKVDGNVSITWSGNDSVAISVSRLDTELISLNATFGSQSPMSFPIAVDSAYNLKLVPSVEAEGEPDVCLINRMDVNNTVSDLRTGTGTLEFGRSGTDPIADIPIYGVVDVSTYFWNLTLPYGQVVWDYLAQPGGCPFRFAESFIFTDSFESGDTSEWNVTVP